jgi:predicted phosphodiesterase
VGKKVLIIGDTHFPFACIKTLQAIYKKAKEGKPDAIVQIGDLYDFYSASSFPRTHNLMTPLQEFEEARAGAEAMWKNLRAMAPKAHCYQLWGNHDVRPKKRVLEVIPTLEHFFNASLEEAMKFKGVSTLCDDRDELEMDGIIYEHGYLKFGAHMRQNLKPTWAGHSHLGGVLYEKLKSGKLLFEANAGYVGDPTSAALSYGRKRWNKWTKGMGWQDSEGPRFIPVAA